MSELLDERLIDGVVTPETKGALKRLFMANIKGKLKPTAEAESNFRKGVGTVSGIKDVKLK